MKFRETLFAFLTIGVGTGVAWMFTHGWDWARFRSQVQRRNSLLFWWWPWLVIIAGCLLVSVLGLGLIVSLVLAVSVIGG